MGIGVCRPVSLSDYLIKVRRYFIMGVFSERDLERSYDRPFDDASEPEAFSPWDMPPADTSQENAPAAFADDARQQAEADAAPAVLEQLNQAKDAQALQSGQGGNEPDDSEDAKRKAHEEAEARRKAEWEARQQAKQAEEQAQLDKLAAMSDNDVMMASMQRVSKDTEKLTRRNMKECVSEHIQTMCLEDPAFARKTMHPRKSMIHCFQYISRKAWDYVQDEMKANGIQPGPGQRAYGADVPDDLCYQWAVDYFNDPDAMEDRGDEEKFVPKPYTGGHKSPSRGRAKEKKEPTKKPEVKKQEPKKSAASGQLTLGGFTMPEEKAG